MKTIVFYISNHGFGHINRNIPIIKHLSEISNDIKIIIKCSEKHIHIMQDLLGESLLNIDYFREDTDVGLIFKKGSLEVDKEKLQETLYAFINTWDEKSNKEELFLKDHQVSLVISDIVPWIFKSCREVGVKSILISNFTWVEIYKELFEDKYIYKSYLDNYILADITLIYPLSSHLSEYAMNPINIGLCCREFNEEKVSEIKKKFNKPIVFISFGRSVQLSRTINVEKLPYIFIFTDGVKLLGSNCVKLPTQIENTQDYIKASDYVITKAGWSTISEAICAKKPLVVLNRKEVAEDRATLEILLGLDIAIPINENELNEIDIELLLNKVESKRGNYTHIAVNYENESFNIAKIIMDSMCD